MSADCVCREIAFRSNEYAEEVRLRDMVLRKPLGIVWTSEELAAERKATHVGCFLHDRLVGTLILTPQNADTVRLSQMAVGPWPQRRGVGSRLIAFAESRATELGYREIVAHARREAAEFYQRLGYSVRGAEFLEVTIPHVEIFKCLSRGLESGRAADQASRRTISGTAKSQPPCPERGRSIALRSGYFPSGGIRTSNAGIRVITGRPSSVTAR